MAYLRCYLGFLLLVFVTVDAMAKQFHATTELHVEALRATQNRSHSAENLSTHAIRDEPSLDFRIVANHSNETAEMAHNVGATGNSWDPARAVLFQSLLHFVPGAVDSAVLLSGLATVCELLSGTDLKQWLARQMQASGFHEAAKALYVPDVPSVPEPPLPDVPDVPEDKQIDEAQEKTLRGRRTVARTIKGALIQICLSAVVALMVFDERNRLLCKSPSVGDRHEEFEKWRSEFFFGWKDVHGGPEICLAAVCCPCVRWSQTISYVRLEDDRFIDPWKLWAGFATCWFVASVMYIDLFGRVLLAFMCAYSRNELRHAYRFKTRDNGVTFCLDFLAFFCCRPCAIAQEAIHVESSMLRGHSAVCLTLVGDPVGTPSARS